LEHFLKVAKLPLRARPVFWLFWLSASAFLDHTNIAIAGPQISLEYGLGNVRLGWLISAFLMLSGALRVIGSHVASAPIAAMMLAAGGCPLHRRPA
jgi:MFS transporter, ACS family, glucarate transporter